MEGEIIMSDYVLRASYILGILAAAAAVILPLIKAFGNPKSLLGTVIGLVILAIIFVIAYSMSGNEVLPKYQEFDVNAATSQVIGGVLGMFYILLGLVLVSIVVTEIARIFK